MYLPSVKCRTSYFTLYCRVWDFVYTLFGVVGVNGLVIRERNGENDFNEL